MDFLIIYPGFGVFVAFWLLPFTSPAWKCRLGPAIVVLNAVLTTPVAIEALGNPLVTTVSAVWLFGDITIALDALSAWFLIIINITSVAGAWYGGYYMRHYLGQGKNLAMHWTAFVLFHYAMILLVSLRHAVAFLVAWEIMSVSSFLLVIFEHTRVRTVRAGLNYLVQTHIGVLLLIIGVIWMWSSTGSLDFSALGSLLNRGKGVWAFLILFMGFAFKAGFIPLHTWLPKAHPAAPSHVSGIMSGVMVTMGVYGILRVTTHLDTHLRGAGIAILILSLATAFYGILNAAIHRDYKRILAFSTIENMGIAGMGIGIGLLGKSTGDPLLLFLGFGGTLLHLLNHALYKPLLFFAAGNVYHLTHTRNMEQLGGLIRHLPLTAFFFLCGGLAITGLPPFNGFISKFLVFSGLIEGVNLNGFADNVFLITAVIGLALVGGLSLLTHTRSFSVIFLGVPRNPDIRRRPESFNGGFVPLMVILFLMLIIGLSPAVVLTPVAATMPSFDTTFDPEGIILHAEPVLSGVGQASLLLIVIAGALYAVRSWSVTKRAVDTGPTWGCGYTAPGGSMQYTGKSFSKSLAKLFSFVTREQKRYMEIPQQMVFPSARSYRTNYPEFFEKNIIDRILNIAMVVMNSFRFIHNGRVQYYILYGLLFVLFLIAATAFEII